MYEIDVHARRYCRHRYVLVTRAHAGTSERLEIVRHRREEAGLSSPLLSSPAEEIDSTRRRSRSASRDEQS